MTSIDKVSDVIVQWAQALQRPVGGTRVNRKIQFGDRAVATAVREKLEALSDTECAFVVRSSTDDDAVKLRNEKPSTVGAGTGVIYLVFWLPGHRGHEKNYESLRDFPSVTLADFLSGTERFVLPGEAAIVGRCREAAAAWGPKDRDRAVEHLDAAWLAVRKCLREHRGGRDSSIPYIDDLPSYLAFLDAAYLPDEAWTRLAEKERPAVLVAAWGSALSRLSMFRLPALASALGVQMRPPEAIPSPSKTGEKRWVGALDEILAENKEVATDFSGLEEDVAGKQTLRERLDDLTRQVPLCENPSERPAAREALERFCQSGDVRAYDQVDWLFRRDPADRRSPSQGLRGLLIARKLRAARVNPLDKLAAETVELLERLAGDEAKDSGVVKDYVAVLRGDRAPDRHAALAAAEAFRCLASGTLSPGAASTPMITAFTRALDSPARDPGDLERLARTWEKYGRPDGDAPVAADGVLFGLTQLCLARLREEAAGDGSYRFAEPGEAPGTLVLSTQFDGERAKPLSIPVQDWSPQTRDRIFQWLRDEVRPLYFGEVEEGDEDEEDSEAAITIDVEWVRGSVPEPFGVMEIAIDRKAAPLIQRDGPESLTSFRREGEFPSGRALTELFRSKAVEKRAEDPRDEGLLRAWQTFTREIGYEPGAAAIGLLSPLPTAARGWVDAWVRAVSAATAGGNAHSEIETLERQIDQAEDILEVRRLRERIKLLKSQAIAGPRYDIESIRSLLSLCTGAISNEGAFRQLFLMPDHPLVLRLVLVGDDILASALRQLWTVGWDKRALEDLEGALEEWGLPEPIRCYGFWDGDPLVFDDWDAGRFALFTPLGSGREVDASRLGVKQVAHELERYRQLFPAAADRLRVRLRGDRECGWAQRVLEATMDRARVAADVEVVTDLPARQPTRIDLAALADEAEGRAFEPSVDGALPAIRIRRRRPDEGAAERVHVVAVVGDLIEAFRSSISLMAASGESGLDVYDPRIFFFERVPELYDYSLLIGDAPDKMSTAVGRLVAQAASHPGQVFREKYSFDRTKSVHAVKKLHEGAHWLVLTSRQPLYRAVQQCGTAKLLDFYTSIKDGRPVHACVSLPTEHAEHDIGRLALSIAALVRHPVSTDVAGRVLDAARSLAPGLAMQCMGATGGTVLSGLLGLLLSAGRSQADDALVVSLDQHRDLLSGTGQLSDLLRFRVPGGRLTIEIVEAKFTAGVLADDAAPLAEAQRQVVSTISRLAQFTLDHPLVLRTRARLARAIVQRIHLGAPERERAERWRRMIEAALDPSIPISVVPAPSGAVHAWSVADETRDREVTNVEGNRLWIYGRDTTLAALMRLGE